MNELLNLITDMVGEKVPAKDVLRLAPILAPVVMDLADGDARLTQENRLKIQEEIEDLKETGEL